ncbi:hypothetical protein KX816_10755 [Sphingosinicellaceae bacterium]|nr:hypothetical protein KX816_10755 [Sphingosinicellaceae bacterium]
MRDTTKLQPGRLPRLGTPLEDPVLEPRHVDGLPVFQPGELITADMLNQLVGRLSELEDRVRKLEDR